MMRIVMAQNISKDFSSFVFCWADIQYLKNQTLEALIWSKIGDFSILSLQNHFLAMINRI